MRPEGQEEQDGSKLEVIAEAEHYARRTQQEFVDGVLDVFVNGPTDRDVILTLCGDAGTGKSHTLQCLEAAMRAMGWLSYIITTTTTHAAAAVMLNDTPTIYSAAALNKHTLLTCGESEVEEELYRYNEGFADRKQEFALHVEAQLNASRRHNHHCLRLNNRCRTCMTIFERFMSSECKPKVFGKSVVVIDEMGMMGRNTFEKVMKACRYFNMDCGMIFILCGSVSQLNVPDASGIWESPLIDERWLGGSYLAYNFRLNHDYELADALACMQHNIITRSCKALLDSCVVVPGVDVHSPIFKPEAVRIFNANSPRDAYNKKCLEYHLAKDPSDAMYDLSPTAVQDKFSAAATRKAWNQFYARFNHVDRYTPLTVCVNSLVTVYRHGNVKHTQAKVTSVVPQDRGFRLLGEPIGGGPLIEITQLVYETPGAPCVLYYPITLSHAINTFAAQGSTMRCTVVYCPPTKRYFTSKIKASAYVACTRVTERQNLILSHNSFASTEGYVRFFSLPLLAFKEQYEMNYDYQ